MNNKTVIHLATWLFASVCLHSVSTASTPISPLKKRDYSEESRICGEGLVDVGDGSTNGLNFQIRIEGGKTR